MYGLWLQARGVNFPKEEGRIRLLTYNTAYCRGNIGSPNDFNPSKVQALADVIRILDADIVALQELDSACTERYRRYLLEDIKKATGIDYIMIFKSCDNYNNGKVGNGVLVKADYPIKNIRHIELPGDYKRFMTRVDLADFTFFATHFDVSNVEGRKQSAIELNNELRYVKRPAFLAGDLNDSHRWRGGAFPILEEGGWQLSSTTAPTLPGDPVSTIDYILFHDYKMSDFVLERSEAVRTLQADNGNTIDVGQISDHYPVFLDIKIPETTGINENKDDAILEIYPNPAQTEIHIKIEGELSLVRSYNLKGTIVQESVGNHKTLDITELQEGIYIVEIHTPSYIRSQRLLVKR